MKWKMESQRAVFYWLYEKFQLIFFAASGRKRSDRPTRYQHCTKRPGLCCLFQSNFHNLCALHIFVCVVRRGVWASSLWLVSMDGIFTPAGSFSYLPHGAEHYLKSWLSLSFSKISWFIYGTRRFITVFTKARHWTLSWASWIQFVPSITVSLRSCLMVSFYLRLGLPSGLLHSGLPTKTL
jgi:hypothetical protein